jgi:hypothetical protein
MTGLLVFLLALHLAAFVVFAIAVLAIHRWREWHHVYIGLAVGASGFALARWAAVHPLTLAWWLVFWLGVLLMVVGASIAWDDALLHARQARDPEYRALAANFAPGTMGGLDARYSWWHRLAHRRGVI